MNSIDINCDIGEINQLHKNGVYKNLMNHVTSINIACGGHAGDKKMMSSMIQLAKAKNINIGAHPSYPDKKNFGRKKLIMGDNDLLSSIIKQINKLKIIAEQKNTKLSHIKPHGALYNEAAKDKKIASIIGKALLKIEPKLNLIFLAESPMILLLNEMGINVISESFADRTYENDYSLRSRSLDNAVIHDPESATEQAYFIAKYGKIKTYDGIWKKIKTETICIHSDTPNAIKIAENVKNRLNKNK